MHPVRVAAIIYKILPPVIGTALLAVGNAALAQVSVWADPDTIEPGGSSTVSWDSGGLTGCTYNGSAFPESGSATVSPSATTTYALDCQGGSGSATVYVIPPPPPPPPPAPEVYVSISPSYAYVGETAILHWDSNYADSCDYGGPSGDVTVGPASSPGTYSFTVTCSGAGGSASATESVVVDPYPQPTMSFSVSPNSIPVGGTATWSWSSTYATECTYAGMSFASAGTLAGGPYTQAGNSSHTATCTGPGGSVSQSIEFSVIPPPTISLSISPSEIYVNTGAATATWTSTNATECDLGSGGAAGSAVVGPYTSTGAKPVFITCSGIGGDRTETAFVNVITPPQPPTVDLTLSSSSILQGESATLTINVGGGQANCSATGGDWDVSTQAPHPMGVPIPLYTPEVRDYTFTWSCSNSAGTSSDTVVLTVHNNDGATSPPSVGLSLSASTVPPGTPVTLDFDISGVIGVCEASPTSLWYSSIGIPVGGAYHTAPRTITIDEEGTYTYTYSCTNSQGTGSGSATLTVTAPPPPPPPVQLSAGFDEHYQARTGDFNSDGLTDIYIALDLAITDIPGVEGFFLIQDTNHAFSLYENLNPAQHALGEQAPLISSQVELITADFDANGVLDLLLNSLSSAISGASDVMVYASSIPGEPPTGYVNVDEDFVSFFTQLASWLTDQNYFSNTAIVNGDYDVIDDSDFILDYWRLDYLTSFGYGAGEFGTVPFVNAFEDVYDSEAEINGCGTGQFESDCFFQDGVWWKWHWAKESHIEFDFSGFNQDAIELIQPAAVLDYSEPAMPGPLGRILEQGEIVAGSGDAIIISDVLSDVYGTPYMGGILAANDGSILDDEIEVPPGLLPKYRVDKIAVHTIKALWHAIWDQEEKEELEVTDPQQADQNSVFNEENFILWTGGLTTTDVIQEFENQTQEELSAETLETLFTDPDEAAELLEQNPLYNTILRDILNANVPDTLADAEALAADPTSGWIKYPIRKAVFHGPWLGNKKFVGPNGRMEAVYDKTGQLVDNEAWKGTFNYYDANTNAGGHTKADVAPWFDVVDVKLSDYFSN